MFENHYHYSIGKRKTLHKLESIMWAIEKNEPIRFHVPSWMEKTPTHIEPEESLEQLCIRSAIRIREEYKYVKLWFSGGIDSTYMLDIFVNNNIHIDEIITVGSGVPNSDWEIDDVASPYLKSITKNIPKTKITVKKPSIEEYKDWYKKDYFFENHRDIGKVEGFYSMRLGRKLQSIHLYDTVKGTVNVVAMDKPCILYRNGEWYAFFLDTFHDNQVADEYNNAYHLFYNDDPLIFTKQCHLLKKAIVNGIKDKAEYNKVCFSTAEKYQSLRNNCVRTIDGKPRKFILKTPIGTGEKEYEAEGYKESQALKYMAENHPAFYKKWLHGIKDLNSIGAGKYFNKQNARFGDVGVFADFKSLDTNSTKKIDQLYPNGFFN